MADSIFPRAIMRERGAAAFRAGKSRDDHAMNWHAPALAEWLTGYDAEAQVHGAILKAKQPVEVMA